MYMSSKFEDNVSIILPVLIFRFFRKKKKVRDIFKTVNVQQNPKGIINLCLQGKNLPNCRNHE